MAGAALAVDVEHVTGGDVLAAQPGGTASWSRVERIIARVEAGAQGTDTRFVVTNLAGGTARTLYEDLYCRRGQAGLPRPHRRAE